MLLTKAIFFQRLFLNGKKSYIQFEIRKTTLIYKVVWVLAVQFFNYKDLNIAKKQQLYKVKISQLVEAQHE